MVWQVLWEVYSYELAGAASLPAAAADLLMLSMLSDVTAARQPLSVPDKSRPGTKTAVYQFNGSVGWCFFYISLPKYCRDCTYYIAQFSTIELPIHLTQLGAQLVCFRL